MTNDLKTCCTALQQTVPVALGVHSRDPPFSINCEVEPLWHPLQPPLQVYEAVNAAFERAFESVEPYLNKTGELGGVTPYSEVWLRFGALWTGCCLTGCRAMQRSAGCSLPLNTCSVTDERSLTAGGAAAI